MSLFDTGLDWLNKGAAAVGNVANTALSLQLKGLELDNAKASIDVKKTQARTAAEIARLQSVAQLKAAQQEAGINTGSVFNDNISSMISKVNSGNNLVLLLTAVGVGIAFLQYRKGRG